MILLLLAGLSFFIYFVTRISAPDFSLLYAELDAKDASHIISKLEPLSIPYKIQGDGTRIYVPHDKVGYVRLMMAKDGIPSGGSLGYEIFDRTEGFGTSSFIQNINHVRALEGELARTIASITQIEKAKVHLVLPKRQIFSRERQQPSASILLKMRGNMRLDQEQVKAIQYLVTAAVPDLMIHHVSIVDDQGTLLAKRSDQENGYPTLTHVDEIRSAFESRLAAQIESLLEKSVGRDKVQAKVAVDMDFDRQTINSELYDPEQRAIRSQTTLEEGSNSKQKRARISVSAKENIENQDEDRPQSHQSNEATKMEEVTNYEVSRTVKSHVKEVGEVRRLSVALLVDGKYEKNEEGELTYHPRSKEELEQIERLVKLAVGYNAERGDNVEVVNMPFERIDLPSDWKEQGGTISDFLHKFGFNISKLAEILAFTVLSILAIFLVIKPLVQNFKLVLPPSDAFAMQGANNEGGPLPDRKDDPRPSPDKVKEEKALGEPSARKVENLNERLNQREEIVEEPDEELDDSKLSAVLTSEDGEVDLGGLGGLDSATPGAVVQRITKVINERPKEAIQVIRSWVYEDNMGEG